MSRAALETIDITEADLGMGAGPHQYPPPSAPSQPSPDESGFVDSSGPILSMYLEMAEEEDTKMAESWKSNAEGILVFTGLFSAAVASLISVSIQDIQQDPQDTSNFYLANIYQATVDPNRSNISSPLPASPPPFSPPNYAVWVNGLWFLSLVISITCALLATLLQQWARRYLNVIRTRSSLHKRARVRSFFSEGVKKSHISSMVEALPTLIHLSLFLFFAGLAVFLWNVNLTIFKVVLSWISFCTAAYGCITLIPLFYHDSPYYSPLTPLARPVLIVILFTSYVLYSCFYLLIGCFSWCLRWSGPFHMFGHLSDWFVRVSRRIATRPKEAALKASSKIDSHAFTWTFDCLDEDHELECFFSGVPGFHGSKVLQEPLHGLDDQQKLGLLEAAIRLLDRTFSSNLLPDQVKRRRASICASAIDLLDNPKTFPDILQRLASEDRYGPLQATEILHFVRRWNNGKSEDTTLVQAMFSIVVARVQQHDDSWFILASKELGISETVLRDHATHSNNLSLAILAYVARQQFIHFRNPSWPLDTISNVLREASKFNVQDTSPELQHEFCALWNQMVSEAQKNDDRKIAEHVLNPIRNVYLPLHQGTDSAPKLFSPSSGDFDFNLYDPESYPVCTAHIHDDPVSTTFVRTDQHDNATPFPTSPASPVAHPFPLPAPFNIHESLRTVPPLEDSQYSHPNNQAAEGFRVPMASPDQASASPMQDIVTSVITASYPTPETSISSPLASISPPATISLQHDVDLLTHSDLPILPSSASNPFLDNVLPTESPHSITVTTAPSASPRPTSAPCLGAADEDDGRSRPGLRKEMDTLDPHSASAIDTNTTVTLDLPPPPSSLPSVTDSDVTIAGHSMRELNAEHTRDHPLDRSHYRYDMV